MSTAPCPDTSAATWIRGDPQPWDALVTLGPAGFPAYARLRFLPDPTRPGQTEADAPEPAVQVPEIELLRRAVSVLASFTTTPHECYFLLWDGWGVGAPDQSSTDGPAASEGGEWRRLDAPTRRVPNTAEAFEPGVQPRGERPRRPRLQAPVVRLPHRAYHLFRGTTGDLGHWGSALPPHPFESGPVPAFAWPGDHAWCLTRDVDPHYAGVGASQAAVDALLRAPDLDVVPADPAQRQPHYL